MFLRDLNKDLKKKQNTFLKVKYKKQTANVFFSNKLHCTYFCYDFLVERENEIVRNRWSQIKLG